MGNRFLFALLAVALLVGCTKPDTFRKEDQYVGRSGAFVVAVYFTGSVTVYKDGAYVLQCHECGVDGTYPELRLQGGGVFLDCVFSDPGNFTASVIQDGGLGLPEAIRFSRESEPVDPNGDGRL